MFGGEVDVGANCAAMRIQAHVWASSDVDGEYMLDVMTDSVCTHGFPRAPAGHRRGGRPLGHTCALPAGGRLAGPDLARGDRRYPPAGCDSRSTT